MTLQPVNPSGSQRFTIGPQRTAPDVRNMTNPPAIPAYSDPLGPVDYLPPVPIKGMPGLYYGKATLNGARGPYAQEGNLHTHHQHRSAGHAVGDKDGVLRLPFATNTQTTPDPAATPYRMTRARFLGVELIAISHTGTTTLFRETSATDPTLIEVTGFSSDGATNVTCMLVAEFNGVPYLLIGYEVQGGATSTLQALADLSNPPTDSWGPTGALPVYGMAQRADGVLMLYYSNRIGLIDTASVSPSGGSITDTATVSPGGYAPGIFSLGGGPPSFHIVTPQEAAGGMVLFFSPSASMTCRGDHKQVSLDGYTVQHVENGLNWTTFATSVRDGSMDCDQTTHVFNNGRRLWPEQWLNGRVADPTYQIVCRGHYTDGTRFWWKANRIKSGVATTVWWEEYDFDTNVSLPCSEVTTLGVDAQSVGGWDLPFTANKRQLWSYDDGAWYRQTQRIPRVDGYDLRGSEAFVASESVTWPVLQYPGLENCPMITAKITGPYNRHILTGENVPYDGTTHAYVQAEELLAGLVAKFHARGYDDRRPERAFSINRSWGYGFQPKVTLARQTGGSSPTLLTPNGFPLTYEFIAFKDGLSNIVPSMYRGLDATAVLRRVA